MTRWVSDQLARPSGVLFCQSLYCQHRFTMSFMPKRRRLFLEGGRFFKGGRFLEERRFFEGSRSKKVTDQEHTPEKIQRQHVPRPEDYQSQRENTELPQVYLRTPHFGLFTASASSLSSTRFGPIEMPWNSSGANIVGLFTTFQILRMMTLPDTPSSLDAHT